MSVVTRPPRDDLFRALSSVIELRADAEESDGRTLFGHFAVFNRFTEIDSYWEGQFMERIAPGAFRKTFKEQRDQIRVLFQHGYDPEVGDKPIAEITDLREDETGAYYEARLLDGVPELVVSGLRAGVYGASFRFRVMREEFVEEPGTSDENPQGLPERTIKEIALREMGPVTWGAYEDATSGLRSHTDDYILDRLARDPERLRRLVDARTARLNGDGPRAPEDALPITVFDHFDPLRKDEGEEPAPSVDAPAEADADASREQETSTEPGAEPTPRKPAKDYLNPKEDRPAWSL